MGPLIKHLEGASADPSFVPGITAATAAPEDVAENVTEDLVEEEAPAEEAAPPAPADGPVFEAADRRGRIVADAEGVRLKYDTEECEFRWDELAAVESAKGRFGKRFTVTVHTPDRRWYPIDIQAPDKGRLSVWESELDAVLDAYFDETAS